jgi:hypothetical protein
MHLLAYYNILAIFKYILYLLLILRLLLFLYSLIAGPILNPIFGF